MRVAISTIALNEAQHVARWAQAGQDADLLAIADTGSTDETVEMARDFGVQVHEVRVRPWRFDIARNTGMSLLPDWDDLIVVTVDMDEVPVGDWRGQLEYAVKSNPDARRFRYTYVWSWVEGAEGQVPDVQFAADRCHTRAGWMWHGAVHEVLTPAGPETQLAPTAWAEFRIEHYADSSKSRSSYLPLLELAVREEPHNPRQRFYLARECFFVGRWTAARQGFVQFLAMPEARWAAERAEAYRYLAKMDDDPERWLLKAVAEDPGRRDAVVDLMDLYLDQGRWAEARGMAARALAVQVRPNDYMSTARVWDDTRLRAVLDHDGPDQGV